ncbi:hypothetical protein FACS189490_01330 [Clostridia bacterium]|nr:hypothetical protein FACS189490_01330 [Clostridia bacterium]
MNIRERDVGRQGESPPNESPPNRERDVGVIDVSLMRYSLISNAQITNHRAPPLVSQYGNLYERSTSIASVYGSLIDLKI